MFYLTSFDVKTNITDMTDFALPRMPIGTGICLGLNIYKL